MSCARSGPTAGTVTLTGTRSRTGSGQPTVAASTALASQRGASREPESANGENSPHPAGPWISAPSRTVMPRNLVGMGIANARSDPSRSSSWAFSWPAAPRPVTPPAVTGPNLTCVVERPLHAVVLPVTDAGGRLLELLGAALDGSGPAVLPLDPDLPADRLAAILDTFAPAAVHTADGVRERPGGRPVQPGTALMIATSGSTGQPKGVELGAAALRHSARATLDRIGATPGQRWLLCLPAPHIPGTQFLIRSLTAGTDPVVVTRADADVLAGSGCAHVSIVPTQLRRLMDADPSAAWAKGFTSVLLGGAAAPAALVVAAGSGSAGRCCSPATGTGRT